MNRLEILPQAKSPSHESAHTHVAGESEYVDDRPLQRNELHVGLVYSPHARARIKNIDLSLVLTTEGVVDAFTSSSLHHNIWGSIIADQPLIASDEVNYVGEIVAVIAASSTDALRVALPLAKVEYEVLEPILSIADAIKLQSFIGPERFIERGDAKKAIRLAPHTLKGHITLGGADHFYLENQASIVYPLEDGRLEVHCSTQHPTEVQHVIAKALGLAQHSVVTITKRLGGGFGGKETQAAPFAVYAALVAHKCKRPARIVLSKDDDMVMTGKRNPFLVNYEVGFDEKGQLLGLACSFFGDGGAYADLSTSILERAMAHADNAYFIPHAHFKGRVCRTNFHSHTAFRGFGGPKGVAMIEHVMEEIAHHIKQDPLDVRKRNCYQNDNKTTPYGQVVENNILPELFATLEERCHYRARRKELDAWNGIRANNPRGMAITAVKFGISFTTRFLNQGHALIHIHRDGSIQVATGAVEMGQGVHARIKDIVAEAFGQKLENIRIMPTATDKSANTSPTAASSGTDLNGSAVLVACEDIKARLSSLYAELIKIPETQWPTITAGLGTEKEIELLEPLDKRALFKEGRVFMPGDQERSIDFSSLVTQAYLSRIALSAYGFYKVPDLHFNKVLGLGRPFFYFTTGVACSEIEIDPVSGEVKVLRTDILMDVGKPVNDALDRGQIAGAFIQGLGWVTTESLYYSESGALLSHSPSTYKIPSIHDIPRIFTIELAKNEGNATNLHGTKAVGEPPLMLCFSVWNAIKNAIAYRHEGLLPSLPVPATAERVLRALRPEAFVSLRRMNSKRCE